MPVGLNSEIILGALEPSRAVFIEPVTGGADTQMGCA
jgi:hypothetical protein